MPIRSFLMSLLLLALSITTTLGSDRVSGTLTVNESSLPVRHVYALLHDNAEGVLNSSPELRILVTDREVPVSSLYGLTFLPVGDLARSGEVQGIVLRFDPANLGEIDLTVLVPNALQKVTDRIKITNFSLGTERINGTFEFKEDSFQSFPEYPKANFSFQIDAFVNRVPAITANLTGKEAVNSPQVTALKAIANALAKGDEKKMESLSSELAARRNKKFFENGGAEAKKLSIKIGSDLKRLIPRTKRVVIRGDTAVIMLPEDSRFELIFENGRWKAN